MTLAQLNFGSNRHLLNEGERNCFLKCNLAKLLFLDFQTLLNFHKLDRLYSIAPFRTTTTTRTSNEFDFQTVPTNRCFILDYQNSSQQVLDWTEKAFETFPIEIALFRNLTFAQTERLLQKGKYL